MRTKVYNMSVARRDEKRFVEFLKFIRPIASVRIVSTETRVVFQCLFCGNFNVENAKYMLESSSIHSFAAKEVR